MAKVISIVGRAPAVRGVDPWASSKGRMQQLFSDEERTRLAAIASIARFKKGSEIYHEGHQANVVFNIISGVAKAYNVMPDGSEYIMSFLFSDDLFGLSEEGKYVNSIMAMTPVTAYQIPVSALRSRLSVDAGLDFGVICKLCNELRQTQRHAFLLARRQALAKVAMFLEMLEHLQIARGECAAEIYMPMNRSDISEYVGMSLEAVSRAFRSLIKRGIIESRNRRHVKIVDRNAFEKLAAGASAPSTATSIVQ
jgi:CRP-like cAMP-binding protein